MSDQIMSQVDQDTFVITSEKNDKEALEKAIAAYSGKNDFHSTYFNENSSMINFKVEDIDNLAFNAQNSLTNIMKINNIIRFFVNKNDILGKVYEAIETNINSVWELTFPYYKEEDKEVFEFVENLITDFNEKINLKNLIVESIPMTYLEGNYALYLRKNTAEKSYQVDYYPLGVYEVADYTASGEPYLLVNIKELDARLKKVYRKNKKNKALFYKNADEEIKDTYPPEVYEAYKNKEQYAVLDIKSTGLMRVNNLKRKYGLSPIFKSLKPVVRLENIELSDDKNTLVRSKKIIFQKLIKELVTDSKSMSGITWSSAQAKAHVDLMAALSAKGVTVFTGLPWTESVSYVENKIEPTNVQVKKSYRDQIMASVGIGYLASDKGSFGAAQISINELLKTINRIGEQLESILEKWYRSVLKDHNIDDFRFCPKIKVLDSEKLSVELSMQIARMLNNELNASLESTFAALGLDVKTEAKRRQEEEELGYEKIFTPRMTAHTNNGKNDGAGRPSDSKNLDKQNEDKQYNLENDR
ncbi:hypothetical protein [Bacillus sp. AG4(2022)]|uniref:hypothetical protein n=1 Tax=Bacillus sp. AG4(2022) TaxID=2962594 RepID=UPI0028821919|nr:hypothetical protein [Bacillus sp. AG4(2022)]MDT0160283.1 hypothetical protein [Bacillus sp. AG4(2022)]